MHVLLPTSIISSWIDFSDNYDTKLVLPEKWQEIFSDLKFTEAEQFLKNEAQFVELSQMLNIETHQYTIEKFWI